MSVLVLLLIKNLGLVIYYIEDSVIVKFILNKTFHTNLTTFKITIDLVSMIMSMNDNR